MAAKLIKIDRNGSKYYEGYVTCDRCGGAGGSDAWKETGWTCYKCSGAGKVFSKWIERTPEYQAKLDARRKAKALAKAEQYEKENAERIKAEQEQLEAKRIAEEAEKAKIKALKEISQYVGDVGEKITITATYDHSAWFDVQIGWKKERMYIHTFKDADGNVLIWKTSKGLGSTGLHEGDLAQIKGTVKDHNEYKDEKQTVLTRCKVTKAAD